jgi:MoaA/NifB/PqqE/SkfB family radical SAM enzyme
MKDMSLETFKSLINEAKCLGLKEVCITGGGEPSLHPDFIDMLKFCKRKGLRVVLTTNLTMKRSLEAWKFVDEYRCSIDGVGATYERIRRGSRWEVVYQNIKMLSKLHNNITINYVIMKQNYHEIEKIIDLSVNLGIKRIAFCFQWNVFPEIAKEVSLNRQQRARAIKLRGRIVDRYDCYHQYFQATVLPNGALYPCCISTEIDRKAKPYGNINDDSFERLWRHNIWNERVCQKCPVPHFNPYRNITKFIRKYFIV